MPVKKIRYRDRHLLRQEAAPVIREAEEISREEKKYREAVGLMTAVDCVSHYERVAISLESAAKLFDTLPGYKDSEQLARKCREDAEDVRTKGRKRAYEKALEDEKQASSDLDLRTVKADLEELHGYEDSQAHMDACDRELERREKSKNIKSRLILAGILVVLLAICYVTPVKPFAKGYIHQKRGEYKAAILNYKQALAIPTADKKILACRYELARHAYEQGNTDKALELCHKAMGNDSADKLGAQIEMDALQGVMPGDEVSFGKLNWVVLDRQGKQILLMQRDDEKVRTKKYDDEGLSWEQDCYLRRYLQSKLRTAVLTSYEKKMIIQADHMPDVKEDDKKLDYLYVLSESEYGRYRQKIHVDGTMWLRDSRGSQASVAGGDGQTGVQDMAAEAKVVPVVRVSTDPEVLVPTPAPTPYTKSK